MAASSSYFGKSSSFNHHPMGFSGEGNREEEGLRLVETLRISIREGKDLPIRNASSSDRNIYCLVKMDRKEVAQSTAVPRLMNPIFGDEFAVEVPRENFRQLHFYLCDQSSGRIPNYRPFARISFRKSDVIKYSDQDKWFPLKPYTRQSDVTGKICLEVSYDEVLVGENNWDSTNAKCGISQRVKLKVLDYSDLNYPSSGGRSVDLYALVTVQSSDQRRTTQKLKIPHHYQRKNRNKGQTPQPQHCYSHSAPSNLTSQVASSSCRSLDSDNESSLNPSGASGTSLNYPPTLTIDLDGPNEDRRPSNGILSALSVSSASTSTRNANNTNSPSSSTTDSEKEGETQLRISLWHDLLGGFQSFFHGEVRIPLDTTTIRGPSQPHIAWYYLKPRNSSSGSKSSSSSATVTGTDTQTSNSNNLGYLRLKVHYGVDHYLPEPFYRELSHTLVDSLGRCLRLPKPPRTPPAMAAPLDTPSTPSSSSSAPNTPPTSAFIDILGLSPAGLLRHLPIVSLDEIAGPLVKIFLHSDALRPLVRCLVAEEISQCQDVNTLFRSSSLATKVMNELLRFVGQQYLIVSLRPCIDRIFMERQCCEIDPDRIPPDQSIEANTQKLIVYVEYVFSRIVDSNHRCPQLLKDIFSDLREVTSNLYPGRTDVQMLVLSSFLVLRFFSAAVLNPKKFGLKRENPDANVCRTLTLVAKVVQKMFNYAVCGHRPSTKEPWLNPVLDHLMDDRHHLATAKFLERISSKGGDTSISGDSLSILREGFLVQRFPKQKACLEMNWITSKRRYCCLTESEFLIGKNKGAAECWKGRLSLSEVTLAHQVDEESLRGKNVFRIGTEATTIILQAGDSGEMNDWIGAIQKQCNRQRLSCRQTSDASQLYEIEPERELEAVHMVLLDNAEYMRRWKGALDGSIPLTSDTEPLPSPEHLLSRNICHGSEPQLSDDARCQLYQTLASLIMTTYNLESAHRKALGEYFREIKLGSKDNPIGDENYLLLKARIKDPFGLGLGGGDEDGTLDVLPKQGPPELDSSMVLLAE